MGKTTKKETDFWGNEKEVHYEDGRKVGETKFRETFWGDTVQDHYDSSGSKTGETRKEEGFFTDKAAHYDSEGNKVGHSKGDTTFFGNKIQRHYNTSGQQVGKSHYEQGFFGGSKKVHDGEYFKSGSTEAESSSYSYGGGSGSLSNSSGNRFVAFLSSIVLAAMCVGLTFGSIWVNEHTAKFSFLWWLSVAVGLVSGYYSIQILIGFAVILGIIAGVIWLITYFFNHPW